MKNILDAIDLSLAGGQRIYIHCWGGVGRTGTTVGCYLVRHGKSGQEALDHLTALWQKVPKRFAHPRSPETEEQMQFVLNWKE
jgi:protein-tyrosine phosphatase